MQRVCVRVIKLWNENHQLPFSALLFLFAIFLTAWYHRKREAKEEEKKVIRFDKFENYSCDGTFASLFLFPPPSSRHDFVCELLMTWLSGKWKKKKKNLFHFLLFMLHHFWLSLYCHCHSNPRTEPDIPF